MAKKNLKKTKSKIVSAAWKLFYEQGYEDTTIEKSLKSPGLPRDLFTIILKEKMHCSVLLPI